MRRNPGGIKEIERALEDLFKKIGPKLGEELKAAYRESALNRFNYMMERAKEYPGKERVGGDPRRWDYGYRRYFGFNDAVIKRLEKSGVDSYHLERSLTWESLQKYPEAYQVDYDHADRSAAASLENARLSFVGKNLVKFENVIGGRTDVEQILFDIRWSRGVFEGHITVTLSDAIVVASVGLKYVLRTIPKVTPYYQYPMLFRSVVVKGKKTLGPSEAEARELLGAPPAPTEEEARAAKGICPGSRQSVPSAVWAKIGRYMSPSASCTVCGTYVSARDAIFRTHKTPAAARAEKVAGGMCEMSGEPVPQEAVDLAIKKALSKELGHMKDYYQEKYTKEPFESYLRMPCVKCGRALEPTRQGKYKDHQAK